jgi:hypothetical protein
MISREPAKVFDLESDRFPEFAFTFIKPPYTVFLPDTASSLASDVRDRSGRRRRSVVRIGRKRKPSGSFFGRRKEYGVRHCSHGERRAVVRYFDAVA